MQTKAPSLPDGLRYEIAGVGPAVMLLHGLAEDGRVWAAQKNPLSEKNTVIIPDLPGSGSSAFDARLRSVEDFAGVVAGIADREKLDRFTLIGHSMGGYIALAFAEKYPERLSGFGLFHSTSYADSAEKRTNRQKSIDFLGRNGSEAYIRQSVPDLFSETFRRARPGIVEEFTERYTRFNPAALIQYQRMMMARPARTAVLQNLTCPVLFVIGEEDRAVPVADSLAQSCLPNLSYIHILEKTAHMGMIEHPHLSTVYLERFLAATRGD